MNRKLLVSVFNPQEAREAMIGGGRIIDSEDPRSALGSISPLQVMDISDTVVSFKKNLEVQLSTNIGEEQYIYDCYDDGYAVLKSTYEIKSKASQAAAGIACAMGTVAHPCNIVKVGVDSMPMALVKEVLTEVVTTLKYSAQCRTTQVMSVFFVQDLDAWNERKGLEHVRRELVGLGKYISCQEEDPAAFNLEHYAVDNLRSWDGEYYFTAQKDVSLASLIKVGALRPGSEHAHVKLNEVRPHSDFFPGISDASTTRAVLKAMVDVTADSGAGAIMLDNRVQSKIARICSVDTASEGLVDINPLYTDYAGLPYHGVLSLEDIRFFVDYCHHRGIEASLAGSLQSAHAQQVWVKAPQLDQMANRDAASGICVVPGSAERGIDSRQHRAIKSTLVRGIVPPEQGGILNIPEGLKGNRLAMSTMKRLVAMIKAERRNLQLPELEVFFSDPFGKLAECDLSMEDMGDLMPTSHIRRDTTVQLGKGA